MRPPPTVCCCALLSQPGVSSPTHVAQEPAGTAFTVAAGCDPFVAAPELFLELQAAMAASALEPLDVVTFGRLTAAMDAIAAAEALHKNTMSPADTHAASPARPMVGAQLQCSKKGNRHMNSLICFGQVRYPHVEVGQYSVCIKGD